MDRVLALRQPDLTVLAERLHKPRNLSAVIRTCDAVGIDEVHVVPGDETPRKHWHTSQGAEKWVAVRAHSDVAAAVKWLRRRGFQLLAAHVCDGGIDYREADYTQPTALVMGTEAFGVSDEALRLADQAIFVPMMGMSQSLNVSVACAVVLYEAQRQRQVAGLYHERRLEDARYHHLRFQWLHPKLARYCRERDLDYPPLDEDGNLAGPMPRPADPSSR